MKNNLWNKQTFFTLAAMLALFAGLVAFFYLEGLLGKPIYLYAIIMVAVFVVVVAAVYLYLLSKGKIQQTGPDYRTLFYLGLVFFIFGSAENPAFYVIGLVFFIVGLVNKKKWRPQKKWSEMPPVQRNFKVAALSILFFLVIGGFVMWYLGSQSEDQTVNFRDELVRAAKERVGQPIEGFNAFIYLEAFPGFEESDFDGVKSLEGVYFLDGEELKYERTAGSPITSAEETISDKGYKILLKNFSKRTGIEVKREQDIATLLEKLREGDIKQVSYIDNDFSIWVPEGWYPYENNRGVFFVHDENLEIPANTDGFALGPWIEASVLKLDGLDGNPSSVEEMFAMNLWVEGSEFLISKTPVLIKGREAIRVVIHAAGAAGEVLHYVFSEEERVFILSHYPYIPGSKDTDDFERATQTFMPNYVFDVE